jgi:hypothetical protein
MCPATDDAGSRDRVLVVVVVVVVSVDRKQSSWLIHTKAEGGKLSDALKDRR